MINSLMQTLSLGPFNFPWIIVPLLLAWILYQILIKRFYPERIEWLAMVDRIMFNSLFVMIVVWKLSPFLFQFSTVVKNPMAALYLPGGPAGAALGLAAAVVFCVVKVRKQKEQRKALVKSLGFNLGLLLVLMVVLSLGTAALLGGADVQSAGAPAAPGSEAPGFSLEAEDGGTYELSDYTGRTVVLNFWASWCPPCRAELPELKAFYEEADSDEVVFLSVNLYPSERDPAGLPAFIKEEGLLFPVLYDRSGQTAADYGVVSIPTTVIIGPDGRISAVKTGAVTKAWLNRAAD